MFEAIGYCVLALVVCVCVVAGGMAIICNNKERATQIICRAIIIISVIAIPYLIGVLIYIVHQIQIATAL